jgi:phasin family protein
LQCNKIFVGNNGPGDVPVAGPGTVRAKKNPQEWNKMASKKSSTKAAAAAKPVKAAPLTVAAKEPVEVPAAVVQEPVELVEAAVKETVKETVKEPVEAAVAVGKETVEAVVKAGAEAASAGYEKAAAITKEQVDRTSKAVFKGYGDFATLGQENVDAVVRSGNIAAKGFEALSKEMMAFARNSLEGNVAATKAISGAKDLREVVDLQSTYTRKSFDQALAESAKLTEMSVKVANEAMQPIQARVTVAVGKLIKPIAA